jgi:hypothetical protein
MALSIKRFIIDPKFNWADNASNQHSDKNLSRAISITIYLVKPFILSKKKTLTSLKRFQKL